MNVHFCNDQHSVGVPPPPTMSVLLYNHYNNKVEIKGFILHSAEHSNKTTVAPLGE